MAGYPPPPNYGAYDQPTAPGYGYPPGQQPGFVQQPGYPAQPGYPNQPGYPPPGYPQPGYPAQPTTCQPPPGGYYPGQPTQTITPEETSRKRRVKKSPKKSNDLMQSCLMCAGCCFCCSDLL